MKKAIWQDLWQGMQGREQTIALRCGDQAVTVQDFFQEILQAEAGLRRLGVGPGDLVTLITLSTPEAVAAFYAIDRIGAVANWVDLKLSAAEVAPYLEQAGSKVVLVLEIAFAKVYENRGETPAEHFVVLPLDAYLPAEIQEKLRIGSWQARKGPDCLSWQEFLAPPGAASPDQTRWQEPAAITYTGGTTGPAKGVMLSRRAFHTSLTQYAQAGREYGAGGASLVLLPIFAAFGLCQCIHVPLCLGMTVILSPLFQPHQLGQLLRQYRPEQVCGTTSYWQLLLQDAWATQGDLSFLKVPRCGGDTLTGALEERLNAFLAQRGSPGTIVKEYGMSEVAGIVCISDETCRAGDVGRPLPGCRILAVDPETGVVCPPQVQGELIIQNETVMNGYYAQPQADAQVLRPGPDGTLWVWTKDLGHTTADGRVVVTGRKKRMISRNGFKIFPSVIEEGLLSHPQVAACAVVGGHTETGEVTPVAHIVPAQGSDVRTLEKELRTLAKKTINAYMLPGIYRFRQDLPLTDRGKLDYLALEREQESQTP